MVIENQRCYINVLSEGRIFAYQQASSRTNVIFRQFEHRPSPTQTYESICTQTKYNTKPNWPQDSYYTNQVHLVHGSHLEQRIFAGTK